MKSFAETNLNFKTPKGRDVVARYRTWPKNEFNVSIALAYSDMLTSLLFVSIYRLPHPFEKQELPTDIFKEPREPSDEDISKVNRFIELDFPNMLARADQDIDLLIAHLT